MDKHKPPRKVSPAATDAPRVSVVVPSHNHSPFVESSLRSIFRQTLPPIELVVIDDGSTDDSPQIIERVLKDCPFPCELIARPNRGLCKTLNEGLAKTRGDYFAYLASDDLWLPEFMAARVALLHERPKAALAYGHAYLIDERETVIDCTSDWAHYADGDVREMLLVQNVAPMSPTVVYNRTALERHGWNERERLEDYELYLRLSAEGDFAFDPRVLSAWRRHVSNTSRDYVWMLEARLAAQQDVAGELNLNSGQLERSQRALRFAGAEDLLRLGEKAQALKFLRQGWRGAPSTMAAGRLLLRLLAPYSLIERRRRQKQTSAAQRYGKLTL